MKAQMPALPVENDSDVRSRYWAAALIAAAAASWMATIGLVRLIAAVV